MSAPSLMFCFFTINLAMLSHPSVLASIRSATIPIISFLFPGVKHFCSDCFSIICFILSIVCLFILVFVSAIIAL